MQLEGFLLITALIGAGWGIGWCSHLHSRAVALTVRLAAAELRAEAHAVALAELDRARPGYRLGHEGDAAFIANAPADVAALIAPARGSR